MPPTRASRTPAEQERAEAVALLYWLQRAAEDDQLFLPSLRKGHLASPVHGRDGLATGMLRRSVERAEEAGQGEVYRNVGRLFAVYHRVPHGGLRLGCGAGSMGTSLSILTQRERTDRLMEALLRSRSRLPWRHLAQACADLRDHGHGPPSWPDLIVDLVHWHRPRKPARPYSPRVPTVSERWWTDYHTHRATRQS
ncbi:type I-E CRISPR-associated protein Cse2/CasB [Streptomyces goshikiensis]|uniref:type I-E CRISPR-associated protein Cse2/CasB n=1 Tax=Streptomyces goshikiensis TaxID=1942 RepID=UPI0036B80C08